MKTLIFSILLIVSVNVSAITFKEVKTLPKQEQKRFKADTVIAIISIASALFTYGASLSLIAGKMIYNEIKENKPHKRKNYKCK